MIEIHLYVKKKIAEALVEWGSKDIAPQLMNILRDDAPPETSFVRRRMAELLASLGDSTIASQLLAFIQDEHVEPHIRASAADALSALDLDNLIADIKVLVTDEQVDSLVRGRAVHCLTQGENGVSWLVRLLEREDIREEVYLALHRASRQAGVRVFSRPKGGYEVLPLQHEEVQ